MTMPPHETPADSHTPVPELEDSRVIELHHWTGTDPLYLYELPVTFPDTLGTALHFATIPNASICYFIKYVVDSTDRRWLQVIHEDVTGWVLLWHIGKIVELAEDPKTGEVIRRTVYAE